MKLRYSYRTLLTFSDEVREHNFLLRCIPFRTPFQSPICENTSIIPFCKTTLTFDTFGNALLSGYIAEQHNAFMFESCGEIDVGEHISVEPLRRLFLFPTQLTTPSAELQEFINPIISSATAPQLFVVELSNLLSAHIQYASGSTNVETTAAQAFSQRCGVCQDYAHIAITLLRLAGIPARYVCGFMIGEGQTHAWIEYYDHGVWRAFDPTNNHPVDPTYIKIAQGRDFNDCSINRGRFVGHTQQTTNISLCVREIFS